MPKSRLVELYAHGLGVIDDARLEFGPGFNVITGETGAGKTLLLGALDLCLGGEGSISRYAVLADMRAAAVFQRDNGSEVVLTREASPTGRLRSTMNGVSSSAEVLRTLATELIVIHGQHDSLALRNRFEILRIIDEAGGVSTLELDRVRARLRDAVGLRDSFGGDSARREREMEFLEFQIREIEDAKITSPSELDETLESLTRLTSLRDGQAALVEVVSEMDSDSDEAVLSRFARAIDRLPEGTAYEEATESLRSALALAREGLHELAALADPDSFDEGVFRDLEERATTLRSLARKYGGSLEAALTTCRDLSEQLSTQREQVERLDGLDEEISHLEVQERELARIMRRERDFAAVQLTERVRLQLPRVALANASLRFDVGGDDGSEAQILFTPNPGLPEGPLQAIASGGELSRVLLALSLETAHEDVVAVFDEIDAGVGGQVAQQIGQCLAEVGARQQVLAVTHLASVASKADHHFVIEKSSAGGTTTTKVRAVEGAERVNEIARMLAGDEITEEAKALASRLLETQR